MTAVLLTIFWGVVALMIAALFLSHLSWWILGEKFFPSSRVCAYVHWHFSSWFSREAKFFTTHMQKVTVFGFIGTLFLFGIVPLNVTILAQIFDLFVENEVTVRLPILGEYGIFPLLVGLLFALVEVALSAVVDFRKSLKQSYLGIVFVLVLMIIVEAGLNIYRSAIMAGDPGISRTFWDNILGISGPLLAGFLGLVVPLATIILGAYAMMDFIIPMINNIAIAARSFFLFTVYGVLVLLFGWHPKTPLKVPESVRRLHDEVGRFKHQGETLANRFKSLQASFLKLKKQMGVDDLPSEQDLDKVNNTISELEQQAARRKPARGSRTEYVYYEDIHSRPVLHRMIDEIKDEIREFKAIVDAQKRKMSKIGQAIKNTENLHGEQQSIHEQYDAEFEPVEELMTSLAQGMADARIIEFGDAIHAALGANFVNSPLLSAVEVEELIALVNPPRTATKQQRDYARATAGLCRTMVSTARMDLNKANKIAQDVREWLSKHQVQNDAIENANLKKQVDELSAKLVELANRAEKTESAMNSQFDAMQKELRMLAWQLYAFIKWVQLQVPLRKRV